MVRNTENSAWRKFSLERTAALLSKKFSASDQNSSLLTQPIVMVISPQSFASDTYSHFSQFVDSADFSGSPTFSSVGWRAWSELEALVENALSLALTDSSNPAQQHSAAPNFSGLTNFQFILVGFSKGCVVLNELLLELSRVNLTCRAPAGRTPRSLRSSAERAARFASSVHRWVWLDGGHNGSAPVWPQDAVAVEALTQLPLEQSAATSEPAPGHTPAPVHVHVAVSPYQMSDSRRPHIGRQCARFCELLNDRQTLGPAACSPQTRPLRFTFELLFEREQRSLQSHFGVLEAFSHSSV